MTPTTFDQAVHAIITGDEVGLRSFLTADPDLTRQRSGSPHASTLLHYVSANGVEDELQRSPKNAPAMARCLLDAGADVDAVAPADGGPFTTTLCMTVTSVHPWRAGVQADLVDVLVDHGAKVDGIEDEGGPLGCALLFGYTEAAERLAARGARFDNIVYAAGLGRTEVVRQMLASGTGADKITRRTDDKAGRFSFPIPRDADAREVALIVAAMHDRFTTVRAFLDAGLSVNAAPFCGQTALHFAAYLGSSDVLDELLARGAETSPVETQFDKTPAEWARETQNLEIAERLEALEK